MVWARQVNIMGEGFAYFAWLRGNFTPPYPPPWRLREIPGFWRNDDRHRWWCWACREYHVNVC